MTLHEFLRIGFYDKNGLFELKSKSYANSDSESFFIGLISATLRADTFDLNRLKQSDLTHELVARRNKLSLDVRQSVKKTICHFRSRHVVLKIATTYITTSR